MTQREKAELEEISTEERENFLKLKEELKNSPSNSIQHKIVESKIELLKAQARSKMFERNPFEREELIRRTNSQWNPCVTTTDEVRNCVSASESVQFWTEQIKELEKQEKEEQEIKKSLFFTC